MIVILAPKAQLACDTLSLNPPPALTIEAEYGAFVCEGTRYTSAHHQPVGSPYVGRHLDYTFGKPAPCNDKNMPVLEDNEVVLISHIDLDTIGGVMRASGKYAESFTETQYEFWDMVEKFDVIPNYKVEEETKEYSRLLRLRSYISKELKENPFPLDKNSDVTELVERISDRVKEEISSDKSRNENTFITLTPFSLILRQTDEEPCNDLFTDPEGVPALAVISYNTSMKNIVLSLNDISPSDIDKGLSCIEIAKELWGESAQGSDTLAKSTSKEMSENDFKIAAELFSKKIVNTLYSF